MRKSLRPLRLKNFEICRLNLKPEPETNIMKKFLKYIIIIFTITVLAVCCRDNYDFIDVEKLQEEELKLLERFYESELFQDSIIKKALPLAGNAKGIDTLDLRETDRLFWARTYRSEIYEDSIKIGQTVGFRYTFYVLDTNADGEPALYLWFTNTTVHEPEVYTAGDFTSSSATICYGIDLGIRNMFLFDKCRMVIPSSIGAQTMFSNSSSFSIYDLYKTIIADIEVTYLPRN